MAEKTEWQRNFETTTRNYLRGLLPLSQYELLIFLASNSTGWFSDMYMGSGGGAGYSVSEGDEGNARFAQVVDEHLPLSAIGMKRDIHGVAMIESEAIVGC
jgi:hypothetical protein